VGDRKYLFPNIELQGAKCLLLKERVIQNLRTLMEKIHALFATMQIEYHISGGTLLGVERHGTLPLPYDDDIDLAVDFKHRDYLFSPAFHDEAKKVGLQTRFLAFTSLTRADRHGAALRLQLLDSKTSETCDVFFLMQEELKTYKIDGWNDSTLVKNSKEQFNTSDVYPRRLIKVDDLEVYVPQNPRALLTQQYGENVFKVAMIRPRLISHSFPMQFLRLLWVPSI
jgi:phosphorylcholine metabolism protein LicD